MGQRQMHLPDSSPLQPQLSGLNNAFGSLASMSGSGLNETVHGGHSSSWMSAGDVRQPDVRIILSLPDEDQSVQCPLLTFPSERSKSDSCWHHLFHRFTPQHLVPPRLKEVLILTLLPTKSTIYQAGQEKSVEIGHQEAAAVINGYYYYACPFKPGRVTGWARRLGTAAWLPEQQPAWFPPPGHPPPAPAEPAAAHPEQPVGAVRPPLANPAGALALPGTQNATWIQPTEAQWFPTVTS